MVVRTVSTLVFCPRGREIGSWGRIRTRLRIRRQWRDGRDRCGVRKSAREQPERSRQIGQGQRGEHEGPNLVAQQRGRDAGDLAERREHAETGENARQPCAAKRERKEQRDAEPAQAFVEEMHTVAQAR